MAKRKGMPKPIGLMRVNEVLDVLKIGRTSLYRGMREGKYPKPLRLGLRTRRWRASDIFAVIDDTPQQQ